MIVATRYGFHGKKGLAGAVTGSEQDADRDPRVRFITFPMRECDDVTLRHEHFDPAPYRKELDELNRQFGRKLGVLITEPYLGGGGSFHPPKAYLQLLQEFCRENDIVFILDEVQANFGRTGSMFAFETYGIEPDIVVLGKGLGNGVPVAAAVGREDLFAASTMAKGRTPGAPIRCVAPPFWRRWMSSRAAMSLAPLGIIRDLEEALVQLKQLPFIAHVRGEENGMVWGVETSTMVGDRLPSGPTHWSLRVIEANLAATGFTCSVHWRKR